MEIAIHTIKGNKTERTITLDDSIFSVEPNNHAIYLDVKQYMANRRQGTHKSKERNEVHGSTRKLHKQKGTGGARKGSIKNPLFRGGGRIFGPQVRDYSFKLNKKVKQLARISALSQKAKSNSITVLEDFNFENPKTKNYVELLGNLEMNGKKTLLVIHNNDKNIALSARNLKGARVTSVNSLNTYHIMNANHLLLSESSIKGIENILSENAHAEKG
ncbi:MAG: 50S ribosomal protein L4 [Bacteroidota bacterium]